MISSQVLLIFFTFCVFLTLQSTTINNEVSNLIDLNQNTVNYSINDSNLINNSLESSKLSKLVSNSTESVSNPQNLLQISSISLLNTQPPSKPSQNCSNQSKNPPTTSILNCTPILSPSIDACVTRKLSQLPVSSNVIEAIRHYSKARELARYLCSSVDMDRELREQFNEIIRGEASMTWRRILCFKSYLMHLNVNGPLVETFDVNLSDFYENNEDCKVEIDQIKMKTLSESDDDECDDDTRRFPMQIYLKIAIIASGNYSDEIKRKERVDYKDFMRKLQEKRLACVVENSLIDE